MITTALLLETLSKKQHSTFDFLCCVCTDSIRLASDSPPFVQYLRSNLSLPAEKLILYGQSIGRCVEEAYPVLGRASGGVLSRA